jgi:hypothetical protein
MGSSAKRISAFAMGFFILAVVCRTRETLNAQTSAGALAAHNTGMQTASKAIQSKAELLLFHPSGPLLSYEVATIKPLAPDVASVMVKLPPGVSLSPLSIRRYIMNAYGAIYAPDWLNKDAYLIQGKIPDDLEPALQQMTVING